MAGSPSRPANRAARSLEGTVVRMHTSADFSALARGRLSVRHSQSRRSVDEIVRLETLRGRTLTA